MSCFVTVKKSGSLVNYKIDFQDDNTLIWSFQSEHDANLESPDLTNIDSLTIDGVSPTYPFTIENQKTYLIEITKTASGAALISWNASLSDFISTQTLPDFSAGDGRWLYALGQPTVNDYTLYRYDCNLLIAGNYVGAGVWTSSPLIATITLPTLPANGHYNQIVYLKNDKILVIGGNTVSTDKYFCLVSCTTGTLDNITDLIGTASTYTTIAGGQANYPYSSWYDYVNNYVYLKTTSTAVSNSVYRLDLDDNTIAGYFQTHLDFRLSGGVFSNKLFFNPVKECFGGDSESYINGSKEGMLLWSGDFDSRKAVYSRTLNKYFKEGNNTYKILAEINPNTGQINASYTASGGASSTYSTLASFDHVNNIYISHSGTNYGFAIFDIPNNDKKGFTMSSTAGGSIIRDAVCSNYTGHHFAIESGLNQRIHIIDTTAPGSATTPDFAYIDTPSAAVSLCTNQIL